MWEAQDPQGRGKRSEETYIEGFLKRKVQVVKRRENCTGESRVSDEQVDAGARRAARVRGAGVS